MNQKIIHSESIAETKAFGASCARSAQRIWALTGNLGAGKTTFAQGFIAEHGIASPVLSPTFTIFRVYPLPQGRRLYHVDLYRLESESELINLGLKDILSDQRNIVLIEWAEKALHLIPREAIWLTFEHELPHGQVRITQSGVL